MDEDDHRANLRRRHPRRTRVQFPGQRRCSGRRFKPPGEPASSFRARRGVLDAGSAVEAASVGSGAIETGSELLLAAGDARASLFPHAGGRLGRLVVGDRALLREPEDGAPEGWGYWGCYPLLPWSNRIPDGTFAFEGRTLHVPVNWSDGTALHGLTAWEPWAIASSSDDAAELTIEAEVGSYHVGGRQRYALTASHLDLELEVRNLGAERVPVGLGIHPWFAAGPVRVPAELIWPGEPMPTGLPHPVGADEDLRRPRQPPPMDRCFTGITGGSVDVPGLTLSWTGPVTNVVVYSIDPRWVCVEPVTMANDGFRLADEGVPDTGVVALDPGASFDVAYRFAWR